MMVIVRLIGGLGNQLFQYAAARSIAHAHGVPLKIDITPFSKYKLHKYSLGVFNITAEVAAPEEIARVQCRDSLASLCKWLPALIQPYYRRPIVKERSFSFDKNIFNVDDDVYLDGYWQSESYFKEIEAIIRRELTVGTAPDAENRRVAEAITKSQAVSLHVRRGDYVANSKMNKIFGTCSLAYYRAAAERIAGQMVQPHFFVFSDDPEWVRNNLQLEYETSYVTHNDADKNYEDLRLMSLCRHHIIANSSFSWWGAWLNPDKNKIVISPDKWFLSGNFDTKDIIPSSWIKL